MHLHDHELDVAVQIFQSRWQEQVDPKAPSFGQLSDEGVFRLKETLRGVINTLKAKGFSRDSEEMPTWGQVLAALPKFATQREEIGGAVIFDLIAALRAKIVALPAFETVTDPVIDEPPVIDDPNADVLETETPAGIHVESQGWAPLSEVIDSVKPTNLDEELAWANVHAAIDAGEIQPGETITVVPTPEATQVAPTPDAPPAPETAN